MNNEIKEYTKAGRSNLIIIYILFLCGIIAPLLPVVGVIFAYMHKDVKDSNLSSHYIFLLRTFCIGLAGDIICFFINLLVLLTFPILLLLLKPICYACLYIWYILRVAIGFKYLLNYEPYENYMTYWIK
ncbi:hypothetical protein [Candidatus Tisiphia endosymbiont of Nemotelus uliginosus]|uniref:hypothetical protein n=1 Tax=Candidatus Tisiphia endosymbiont of Nemotelus uliginosus TaxID=3077926 RepID=UPI0035C8BBD8